MHNKRQYEKVKDFKGSIQRLLKGLKGYRIFIILSLILAFASAILSISAPNKLSKITDEISKGLVINTDNLKILNEKIMNNQSRNIIVVDNVKILLSDQMKYIKIVSSMDKNEKNIKMYKKLDKLPNSIRKVIEPKIKLKTLVFYY